MAIESTVTMPIADYVAMENQIKDRDDEIRDLKKTIGEFYQSDQVELYRKFIKEVLIDPSMRQYVPHFVYQSGPDRHEQYICWIASECGADIIQSLPGLPYLVKIK